MCKCSRLLVMKLFFHILLVLALQGCRGEGGVTVWPSCTPVTAMSRSLTPQHTFAPEFHSSAIAVWMFVTASPPCCSTPPKIQPPPQMALKPLAPPPKPKGGRIGPAGCECIHIYAYICVGGGSFANLDALHCCD